MKKMMLTVVLLTGYATLVFSQARPILAVLPFTGGVGGDGETIATLLSFQPEITNAFTVVPRTAALDAIFAEHEFQLDGLTDADTIAGIGRMLNAEFVLSGNIRRLGDRNIVIATIIHVESFQQVAGYHRTYSTIEEVRGFLPSMARDMVATSFRDTSGLPSLAILPLDIARISVHDAETLAKILAIEILHSGSYVVLPRTSAIETAQREMDFQMWGYTTDEGAASLGQAFNANLALAIGARSLGAESMFTAQILDVRDGRQITGYYRTYQVITDGVHLMAELAILLTIPPSRERDRRLAALPPPPRPPRQPRPPRSPEWAARMRNARRDSMGLSLFFSWEDGAWEVGSGSSSAAGGSVFVSSSLIPYTAVGLEARLFAGGEAHDPDRDSGLLWGFTASPSAGLVFPFGSGLRIFTNTLLEMGRFGPWHGLGLITDWMTPGFDAGFEIGPLGEQGGINIISIRYHGIWFQNRYTHGIGLVWGVRR